MSKLFTPFFIYSADQVFHHKLSKMNCVKQVKCMYSFKNLSKTIKYQCLPKNHFRLKLTYTCQNFLMIWKLRYYKLTATRLFAQRKQNLHIYDCRWYEGQAKMEKKKQAKGRSIGTLFSLFRWLASLWRRSALTPATGCRTTTTTQDRRYLDRESPLHPQFWQE